LEGPAPSGRAGMAAVGAADGGGTALPGRATNPGWLPELAANTVAPVPRTSAGHRARNMAVCLVDRAGGVPPCRISVSPQ